MRWIKVDEMNANVFISRRLLEHLFKAQFWLYFIGFIVLSIDLGATSTIPH
jgi:hypothetical protein